MTTSSNYISSLPVAKHRLSRNFRNTRKIFTAANRYYRGEVVRPIGPEGRSLVIHTYTSIPDLQGILGQRIGHLISNENINAGDIAILVQDQDFLSALRNGDHIRVGRYSTVDAETIDSEKPVVDTIRRFKGLEKPVVFLVLTVDMKSNTELLYTGYSRAQSVLELFVPPVMRNVLDIESE